MSVPHVVPVGFELKINTLNELSLCESLYHSSIRQWPRSQNLCANLANLAILQSRRSAGRCLTEQEDRSGCLTSLFSKFHADCSMADTFVRYVSRSVA